MTRYEVSFSVSWVHGWQRAGINYADREHFTQGRTATDEQEIGLCYNRACRTKYGRKVKAPQHVPVTLYIDAYAKEPKGWPRGIPKWLKPFIPFVKKPDVDNIAKLMDGLNKVAWYDDAQVTKLIVTKHVRNGVQQDMTIFTVVWEEE